jgi:hypothetical protein
MLTGNSYLNCVNGMTGIQSDFHFDSNTISYPELLSLTEISQCYPRTPIAFLNEIANDHNVANCSEPGVAVNHQARFIANPQLLFIHSLSNDQKYVVIQLIYCSD